MLYVITLFVLIINLFCKKSKIVLGIDFVFLLLALGFSYGPYDTMIFIDRFTNYKFYEGFTEILFNSIVLLGHKVGLDYRSFMIACSFIELTILLYFIKKNTNNYCYVIGLFLLYPMVIMFEQLRFFMAFTIIIIGVLDNIVNKNKFYKIKSIIFTIVASLIHISSIYFVIFILVPILSTKKTIIISTAVTIMLFSISFISSALNFVEKFVGDEKLSIIGTEISRLDNNYGRTFLIFYIIFVFSLQYIFIRNDKKYVNELEKAENKEFLENVFKFNVLCLPCIPLTLYISPAFYRVPQGIMILSYIAFSKYLTSSGNKIRKKEFIFIIFNILYAISTFLLLVHSNEAFKLILFPFFEENEFFNF